jgi:eukaryotic-like serine/threonine-protein kinase
MSNSANPPDRDDALTEPDIGGSAAAKAADISDPDAAVIAYAHGERYEERTTLGKGGMGEVRLCGDRATGREVAMKIVHPINATHGGLRARFIREARVQAQLEHPAIVPVYDFGVDSEGREYFTMKRVRGVTLENIIERLRRSDVETVRQYGMHRLLAAFVQVCRAIDYAHERGVLHRDLKPANVMLGPYGEVYVLDWGLAKVRSASRDLDAARTGDRIEVGAAETAAGEVFGTPRYMAPEQVRGDGLDERTDVYSLGAILFELLTLEPLHGDGPAAAMMARAVKGVDARPAARAPSRAVPPELDLCCVHASALDRQDRFASARELADAVEAYLSGDRDLELRRELAAVHLDRARDAAARAFVPGAPTEERREALAEAGRAVALAPEDPAAQAVLVDLLTRPPERAPPEVLAAMESESVHSHMKMLPGATFTLLLPWLLVLPAIAAIGVRDATLVAVSMTLWAVAAAHTWRAFKRGRTSIGGQQQSAILMACAVAGSSVFFGPMIVAPAVATGIAMSMVLHQREDNRRFLVVAIALAVVVPTLLAAFGLHPVSHGTTAGGAITIFPAAIDFPPVVTLFASTGIHLLVLFAGVRYALHFRSTLTALSLANRLQSWQLEHLVPRDAAIAMHSRPPPAAD